MRHGAGRRALRHRQDGAQLADQARDAPSQLYKRPPTTPAPRHHHRRHQVRVRHRQAAGTLHLIDEALTPDSSRFWPADQYQEGINPPSFDKQYVRDYLETLDWNKTAPGPNLPADVIERTSAKYREAYEKLTGRKLD
jgi:phosphoribosylaminoimidazole-succinocarboxamide synthase